MTSILDSFAARESLSAVEKVLLIENALEGTWCVIPDQRFPIHSNVSGVELTSE
jgi:hypothetical protein